jgi:hypothetical protein
MLKSHAPEKRCGGKGSRFKDDVNYYYFGGFNELNGE